MEITPRLKEGNKTKSIKKRRKRRGKKGNVSNDKAKTK
jgi:hypothetical protein